jgi:hypothetical protein
MEQRIELHLKMDIYKLMPILLCILNREEWITVTLEIA